MRLACRERSNRRRAEGPLAKQTNNKSAAINYEIVSRSPYSSGSLAGDSQLRSLLLP